MDNISATINNIEYIYNNKKGSETHPILCPFCGKYLGEKFKGAKGKLKLWCKQEKKEVTITL
jgi:hypothetical protein